jgi:hypothetical protein
MDGESQDLTQMDDVEFIAERRRVRDAVDRTPTDGQSFELLREYAAIDAEFMRRAGLAWQS